MLEQPVQSTPEQNNVGWRPNELASHNNDETHLPRLQSPETAAEATLLPLAPEQTSKTTWRPEEAPAAGQSSGANGELEKPRHPLESPRRWDQLRSVPPWLTYT